MSEPDGVLLLRRASAELERFLQRVSALEVTGSEEERQALLHLESVLQSVAAEARQTSDPHPCPELRQEAARYRNNLLRLQEQLDARQRATAHCRDQVLARQNHLRAARAWCAAARAAQ